MVSIGQGSARTLARGHEAVLLEEVARIGSAGEIFLETRRAGGALAFQEAERAEHHRCGADGCHTFAGRVLRFQRLAHAFVSVEVRGAGHAAGEHQQVGILKIAVLKLHVGLDGHTVRRFHKLTACHAHRLDVYTAPTQNVHGSQALDLFKTVS